MTHYSIISIAIFSVIFMVLNTSAKDIECTDSVQCNTNYCRNTQCINFGDDSNDVGRNPCSMVRCAGYCVLQQVQCIRFPCPPTARCVSYKESPSS